MLVVDDGILTGRQRADIACSLSLLLLIVAHIWVDLHPNRRHVGTFICDTLIVLDKERSRWRRAIVGGGTDLTLIMGKGSD